MNGMTKEDGLRRNLHDAGCEDADIQKFLELERAGRRQEQYRLLAVHRAQLLDQLHVSQREIDCLDYLVYMMKKEGRK